MGCANSTQKKQVNNPKRVNKNKEYSNKTNSAVPTTNRGLSSIHPGDVQDQIDDLKNNLNSFQFSTTMKFKKAIIKKDQNCKVCKASKQDVQQYVLIEPDLDMDDKEKTHKIKFKIQNIDDKYSLLMGIAHQDRIHNGQYIKKGWFDEIDHGLYAIDDFGFAFNNVKEKFNNKKIVGWGLKDSLNAIIHIEVDPANKKIIFRKEYGEKEYEDFEMPISTKEIIEDGVLNFFICFGGQLEIKIME